MSGIYYTDLVDVLTAAGVECRVTSVNAGWEHRARSSGGFANPPLGIFWHHSASSTTPENDLAYICHNADDAPIGNMLLDRDGIAWPVAAGASNCAGKGGPAAFSRGTIPKDSGNSQGWNIEAANDGLGEPWPQAQIDAYFKINNALSARFGNSVTDLITHHEWAPDRKIDPARAEVVQGPWQPAAINSSGTWSQDSIRNEAVRRANPPVPPIPGPQGDLMYKLFDVDVNTYGGYFDEHGIAGQVTWLTPARAAACLALGAPHIGTLTYADTVNCDLLGRVPPNLPAGAFDQIIG